MISRLLIEFKGDTNLDEQMILLLLEPQIDILLMSVKALNCKFPCCSSKPQDAEDREVQVYHKMKLNKIEKKRVEDAPTTQADVESVTEAARSSAVAAQAVKSAAAAAVAASAEAAAAVKTIVATSSSPELSNKVMESIVPDTKVMEPIIPNTK